VTGAIRVVIADHDAASREGVRLALKGKDFDISSEAGSADSAAFAAGRDLPDICLVEADLPGGGVAAAERVLAASPQTVVVMLSAAVDDNRLFAAVRVGARGYLLKDMDPERLPMALRGVLNGEAALPRPLMGRVLKELRAVARGRHASELSRLGVDLTRREREVLELLDRGLATAQIGQLLGISAVTVRRHVSHLVQKLRAPDRDGALRLVRESGEQPFSD